MGLTKVHLRTWPEDRSVHVRHGVASLPGSSGHFRIKEQSYPQSNFISYMDIINGQRSPPCWLATQGSSQPCDLILLLE